VTQSGRVVSLTCTFCTLLITHYSPLTTRFDYIITGSGCAGFSLLYRMLQHPFFSDKKILVIDQSPKTINDHTWCFWEQQSGIFEEIVYHKWKQLDFYSNHFSARYDIFPYEYKMIRAIDFYNNVFDKAKQHQNILFYYGKVQSVQNENNSAVVTAHDKKLYASYIFNSIIFDSLTDLKSRLGIYFLFQHFKGWLIQTSSNFFDQRVATFMDFRVSQDKGTAFVYVLPVASNKALIEYTLISEKLLQEQEYDEVLKNYIEAFLKLNDYTIVEKEFGIIPMTNHPFSKGEGRIVNIGTAGGQTKASSGFTFNFIQKHCDDIISALINNKDPHITPVFSKRRFNLYDSTLLNILYNRKMSADKIFADLFKRNKPQRVLKFLDNETNFGEDLKIMRSVSTKIFLPATIKEIFK